MVYPFRESDRSDITGIVREIAALLGLAMVADGIDNHGSLIWTAGRSDDLARQFTFALTEGGDGDAEPAVAELWIGADNGTRFMSKLIHRWAFNRERDLSGYSEPPRLRMRVARINAHVAPLPLALLDGKIVGTADEESPLFVRLAWAWNLVAHVGEADLDGEFVAPRMLHPGGRARTRTLP